MSWKVNNNIKKYFYDNYSFKKNFTTKQIIKRLNDNEDNITKARLICKRIAELMPTAVFNLQNYYHHKSMIVMTGEVINTEGGVAGNTAMLMCSDSHLSIY
jgi:hypothetical protein